MPRSEDAYDRDIDQMVTDTLAEAESHAENLASCLEGVLGEKLSGDNRERLASVVRQVTAAQESLTKIAQQQRSRR
jgi:hypothetical protein